MPDAVEAFLKEYLWQSHFCHLKYHVTGMPDHLGSDLYQFQLESPKRPVSYLLGQCQSPRKIAEVSSQSK